jgi:hypothetical protein
MKKMDGWMDGCIGETIALIVRMKQIDSRNIMEFSTYPSCCGILLLLLFVECEVTRVMDCFTDYYS